MIYELKEKIGKGENIIKENDSIQNKLNSFYNELKL